MPGILYAPVIDRSSSETHVVFRGNSPVIVAIQTGNLLQDILTHARNFTKEEDGEDTGADAESRSDGATKHTISNFDASSDQ